MYIRTKDGVYEVVQSNDIYTEVKGNTNGVPLNDGNTAIHFKEILKQSETIEELCDEYVIDNWKEKGKPVYCFKYVKETNSAYCIDEKGYLILYIPQMLECGCIIKGAIWTDKGLIYVAKFNDKGDLELI